MAGGHSETVHRPGEDGTKEGINEGKEVWAHSQDSRPDILSGTAQKFHSVACSSVHNPREGQLPPSPATAPNRHGPCWGQASLLFWDLSLALQ